MTKKKNFDPANNGNLDKASGDEKSHSVPVGVGHDSPIEKGQLNSDADDPWERLNQELGSQNGGTASQNEKTVVLASQSSKDDKTEIIPLLVPADSNPESLASKADNLVQGVFTAQPADLSYPSVAIPAFPQGESVSFRQVSGDHFPSGGDKTLVVTEYSNQRAEVSKSQVQGLPNPALSAAALRTASGKKDGRRIVRTEVAVKVNSAEASLIQSENLRLAQEKIESLEQHIEQIRGENEELAASAEIFKNMVDDLHRRLEVAEKTRRENEEILNSEAQFLKESNEFREKEIYRIKEKNADLEQRINNDLRKIRVRERELENRLELLKMEKNAIVKSKDETILELKRKLDLVEGELETYKRKTNELGERVEGGQDQMRRTVRALRIALSHLESNEDAPRTKKAE